MTTVDVLSNSILCNNDSEQNKIQECSRNTESSRNSIYHKCHVCSKKVMSHGKCKCSNFYCGKHLHQHNCTYSYFQENKSLLEKKNIKIESDKLIKL